jgi:hypothetical protein
MSRGSQLSAVRALLFAELRESTETNATRDAEFNSALIAKQDDLCIEYDWPFLKRSWDVSVVAGSRYLSLPTADIRGITCTPNLERPIVVERLFNTKYVELGYGIGSEQYNYRNSDNNERLDPIQRWELVTNTSDATNADQFEIWPRPTTAQTIRFTGQRKPLAIAGDTDKFDLDDRLLAYFTAADYLLFRDQANAKLVLAKAQGRLLKLRAGNPAQTDPLVLGKPHTDPRLKPRTTPLIITA